MRNLAKREEKPQTNRRTKNDKSAQRKEKGYVDWHKRTNIEKLPKR